MNPADAPIELVLYGREGCHLCDDAREVIEDVAKIRRIRLVEVDIESSDRLMLAYLERIPVVECNGDEWFEYHVDRAALIGLIDRTA